VQYLSQSLIEYLNFGEKIGSIGTIFHVGSYGAKESNPALIEKQQQQVILAIKKVLEATPLSQLLIMENAAGGGGRVGATLEELIQIYKAVNSTRFKVCLDTQHLFATGIDVRNPTEFSQWLEIFDREIGINNLVCVHLNDSQTELGSKHDRHENIGEGKIGREGIKNILNQPLLQDKPLILEVPGFAGKGPDKKNIEILRELLVEIQSSNNK
jgi:deoxyribonuclease-4